MSEFEFKGTPGPWIIDPRAMGHVISPSADRPICSAMGYMSSINGEAVAAANKANARLIAAAPELFEALKCALAQLQADHDGDIAAEMFGGEPDPARAMNINRHDVAEMVEAALSHAVGR